MKTSLEIWLAVLREQGQAEAAGEISDRAARCLWELEEARSLAQGWTYRRTTWGRSEGSDPMGAILGARQILRKWRAPLGGYMETCLKLPQKRLSWDELTRRFLRQWRRVRNLQP